MDNADKIDAKVVRVSLSLSRSAISYVARRDLIGCYAYTRIHTRIDVIIDGVDFIVNIYEPQAARTDVSILCIRIFVRRREMKKKTRNNTNIYVYIRTR